jgi:DNA-binding transcriptional MerR regulator
MARVREDLLSIGEVANATGISPDTIRVWERRYGKPQPIRLPSGHRRYSAEHVRWLRRVAMALSTGQRASAAVRADEETLAAMIEVSRDESSGEALEELFEAVREYQAPRAGELLWREWRELGPLRCLTQRLGPLVTAAGHAWADGDLCVRHEHFLSEVVVHFLKAARLSLPPTGGGKGIVLATLAGETHTLGIHMAAVICAMGGARPIVLGAQTPLTEIVGAAVETSALAVAISVSVATGGVETDRALGALRRDLPREIRLVVGGRGARGVRRGPRGVEYPDGLEGLLKWVEKAVA